ncbi:hypothetical protein LTR36_006405 [Oleoguttula mirabilis]|uniref:Uncharacterized protein n=1 Tax=Oleoguttula mirabilis TaxID=1507867 RepID=A0AAV9JUY8_9PEZI|nr:hypothetical protein LTR36_006405 [Oleoguttula mirabilis]
MKLATLLSLPAALAALVIASTTPSGDYNEHLHLKPLPGGHLYAGFNFTATTSLHDYDSQHFRYFPRSLAQILQHSHTRELHLRFALGRWDEESWGSRPRDGRREGGTGVELWAWVEGDGDAGVVDERWSSLVNSLSGLFCASLNFIDGTKTTRPVLSFEPEGVHRESDGRLELLHGTLPHEVVCTENLTPFLKLLPCKGKAGISSLLDGHKVFDATWQTMSIDVRPVCHRTAPREHDIDLVDTVVSSNVTTAPFQGGSNITHVQNILRYAADLTLQSNHSITQHYTLADDGSYLGPFEDEDCHLEIQQTVDMVLDIERSMRPRDDPIPRPPPIEQLECDAGKSYNSHDTCYPKPREGHRGWSLSRVFGQSVKGNCHLDGDKDQAQKYDVSLEVPLGRRTVDIPPATSITQSDFDDLEDVRQYRLPSDSQDFDLTLPHQPVPQPPPARQEQLPPLYASRQITGYGQERGSMHTTLRNPHSYAQRVVYLESLPWFLRPYMHTLKVEGHGSDSLPRLEKMYYTPSIDRQRGTQLELLLEIPAQSTVEMTYDFEKAVLRYTEYPPDANRGFDVAPAVIRVLPLHHNTTTKTNSSESRLLASGQGQYLRTTSLLLPLPTPDFSMPYNVIILTSTVIALGFGSIFNLLVRQFVLVEEVPTSPLAEKVRAVVARVREAVSELRPVVLARLKSVREGVGSAKGGGGGGDVQEPMSDGVGANGGLKPDGKGR